MVPTRVTDKGGVGYPVVQGDRRAGAGRVESVTAGETVHASVAWIRPGRS
jgi:hypothetical protein